MPYSDPRLIRLYDVDNPDGPDHDFFRALVDVQARRVVDLGCGTGILTVTLAQSGREVLGIDPSKQALDFARSRPGGDAVTWLVGTAADIEPSSADVIIMSGNVAMHILGEDWTDTLARIAAGLTERGVVAFESRNPEAAAWRDWSNDGSERDTADGRLQESCLVDGPDATGRVVMHIRNQWPDEGNVVAIDQELQFRSHLQILEDLRRVQLTDVRVYRNWAREHFTGGREQPLMVFVARKGIGTSV